ncbi:MAG: hypothetical protein CMN30_27210 [Sandaracinus sp.]|nr:hypothetical protein [Sandaracinus sp.]
MKRIDGRARTVRELLDGARYTIDFYQREYAWQERQVQELIDDLSGKFLDFYEPEHERGAVEEYGHYFLGSIVISHKRSQKFIVDGQQRLTTLTLLLIYLHHLQEGREHQVPVERLIFGEKYGRRSFNLDVPDRAACMEKLFLGETFDPKGASESVQNIAARYDNINDHFPEELTGEALPYFIDWLRENVHLVEIEAYSDEDAYTIFETMNDRGLSLSLPEMLKGYVLANITHEADQRTVNESWKKHIQALRELGPEEDVDFFKSWLRARHAETIRPGKKGAENKDYERIGSEFHRWVRDQKDKLGLHGSADFVRFVERDLDFYSKQAQFIRKAESTLVDGLESIRFNRDRGFTMQMQVLLASLTPDDAPELIKRKMGLAADYLDIWLARRAWNFRRTGQSTVRYTIFSLTRDLRGKSIEELSTYLRELLDQEHETFARTPDFRLHQQNYRQVRHILARLTYWVDHECGVSTHFDDLVSQGKAKPFEVEHIWANQYEQFSKWFEHPRDFEVERNRLGGLVLLQSGHNQSLGDLPYAEKRDAYVSHGQSLLTRSLHPLAYKNNPSFRAFIERTGLGFRPIEEFTPEAQAERQELYLRIAEWVWNPSRLDLDGTKPPVPEPLEDPEDQTASPVEREVRLQVRKKFWTALLERVKRTNGMHGHLSPRQYHWLGARKDGMWWNYVVLQDQTRVELYIDRPEAAENKATYDRLAARKPAIENAFGGSLEWQRLDDKRASRISTTIDGGWVDEQGWDGVIEQAVDAMARLYSALRPALRSAT